MGPVRDTLIVLNRRFLPPGAGAAYLYGVVQHALRAAEVLRAAGARVGFVLYERCEEAAAPSVEPCAVPGRFPGAVVRFNFGMEPAALVGAFRSAAALASVGSGRPLLYLQTSVLLPYAPPELDVVVTHHSPFVDGVARALGPAGARRAFEWDHPKADHLARMQAEGLAVAAGRGRVRCGEISMIREAFLLGRAVARDRVARLPQPLDGAPGAGRAPLPAVVERAVTAAPPGGRLVAVTAVSRLDYFKNVELFVRGAVEALRQGSLGRAVVVGGFPDDPERDRLRALVPRAHREAFVFAPRVPRDALVGSLFPRLAPHGVFVCTSRFDLVPYTALEAARAGLCTVVPGTGLVGTAEYLPAAFRFAPSPGGVAEALGRLAGAGAGAGANGGGNGGRAGFRDTAEAVRRGTSGAAFLAAFRRLCRGFA